jgi:hypothetical protein
VVPRTEPCEGRARARVDRTCGPTRDRHVVIGERIASTPQTAGSGRRRRVRTSAAGRAAPAPPTPAATRRSPQRRANGYRAGSCRIPTPFGTPRLRPRCHAQRDDNGSAKPGARWQPCYRRCCQRRRPSRSGALSSAKSGSLISAHSTRAARLWPPPKSAAVRKARRRRIEAMSDATLERANVHCYGVRRPAGAVPRRGTTNFPFRKVRILIATTTKYKETRRPRSFTHPARSAPRTELTCVSSSSTPPQRP